MVQYRNFLLEAREVLHDDEFPVRERLARAGRLFWQAYVYQGSRWPRDIQEQGGALLTKLVSRGRIRATAESVDEKTAQVLCRELADFIDSCTAL